MAIKVDNLVYLIVRMVIIQILLYILLYSVSKLIYSDL